VVTMARKATGPRVSQEKNVMKKPRPTLGPRQGRRAKTIDGPLHRPLSPVVAHNYDIFTVMLRRPHLRAANLRGSRLGEHDHSKWVLNSSIINHMISCKDLLTKLDTDLWRSQVWRWLHHHDRGPWYHHPHLQDRGIACAYWHLLHSPLEGEHC
jgi:hypothetical protein